MESSTIPLESDYSFDSFLKISLWMWSLAQIKFEEEVAPVNVTFKKKCLFAARKILRILLLVNSFLGFVLLIIYALVKTDDVFELLTGIGDAFITFQITFKVFSTLRLKKEILETFQDLKDLSDRRAGSDLKYQVKSYFNEYQRLVKIYAFVFLMGSLPNVGILINFWISGVMMIIPAKFWYPFDPYTTSTYPIAALFVLWMNYIYCLYLLAVDSLIFGLITIVAMEFDILKLDLSEVDFTSDEDHAETLKTFIERHNKLYEITDRLQKVYGSTFFLSFLISSATICLISLRLSQSNMEIAIVLNAVSYIGLALGQILLLSVYGQKLIDSSAAVADGIYNSNWNSMKKNSLKRQLVLMIQRSQKEKKLTALNFADISLNTFTKILYSAYSYYTFVQNLYNEN